MDRPNQEIAIVIMKTYNYSNMFKRLIFFYQCKLSMLNLHLNISEER